MTQICIALAVLLTAMLARAEVELNLHVPRLDLKPKATLIGHNVTPTTDIPEKGVWTLGNYAFGLSVNDHLFIATSPWIWTNYNTANFHVKVADRITRHLHYAIMGSYFESYDSKPLLAFAPKDTDASASKSVRKSAQDREALLTSRETYTVGQTERYQWKSSSLHFLASYDFGDVATVYANLNYGYFWNDDFPYSIRMDPGRDTIRGQIDATSLTRIRLGSSDMHALFEFGGLGLNYESPYLQIGGSLAMLRDDWLIQFGASLTMPFEEALSQSGWTPGRYDSRSHWVESAKSYYVYRYLQTGVHPEVQIQYYF